MSRNAVKHGLLAEDAVIHGEDPEAFETHRQAVLGELKPVGVMETILAERAAGLIWRLYRAERMQGLILDDWMERKNNGPIARIGRALSGSKDIETRTCRDLKLGRVAIEDFVNYHVLDRLEMYERRLERSLYRALAELGRRQALRRANEPAQESTPQAQSRPDRTDSTLPKVESTRSHPPGREPVAWPISCLEGAHTQTRRCRTDAKIEIGCLDG